MRLAILAFIITMCTWQGISFAWEGSSVPSSPTRAASPKQDNRAPVSKDELFDALLTVPGIAAYSVSPDSRWVAWSWFRIGPAADVYAAPTSGHAAAIQMTKTDQDTLVISWTKDSRAIIVGQDHDGDERVRLIKVALDKPRVMLPLTEESPKYYLQGGQLHPNGRWLVYGANFDFVDRREIEPTWVYRHDLATGERKVLARPAKAGGGVALLNREGTHLIYDRNDLDPSGQQIWLVDIEGGGDREILNFGAKEKVAASWLPDGKRIIFLAEAGDHRRLGIFDRTDGSTRWLIDDPARNVEEAFVPEGSKQAVIVEIKKATRRCTLLNVETGKEVALPGIPGNLIPLAPVSDREWAGAYYNSRQPGDIVRFPIGSPAPGEFTSLTRLWERTPLTPADLTAAEDFTWKSSDGLEIHGWLYKAGNPKGTIVFIHGGPTYHDEDDFDAEIQALVGQGFNVLDPNYRGSTGYGLSFQDSIKKEGWGGPEQDDIKTGIEALIARGIALPGKIGVTGTSYGGYCSWHAITHWSPDLVAAAAPICGMTDLVVDYETTRPDLRPYSEEMMGGSPDQVPERYKERSPINFVGNIKGKLLIVQGLQDPNVTPQNASAVEKELKQAGIPYELLAFEDEGHGIHKPRNQRLLYKRLADFFSKAFASE